MRNCAEGAFSGSIGKKPDTSRVHISDDSMIFYKSYVSFYRLGFDGVEECLLFDHWCNSLVREFYVCPGRCYGREIFLFRLSVVV